MKIKWSKKWKMEKNDDTKKIRNCLTFNISTLLGGNLQAALLKI